MDEKCVALKVFFNASVIRPIESPPHFGIEYFVLGIGYVATTPLLLL